MAMITHIAIENFQSISSAQIELGAWTSLVGESDVGKSAIIRALYALLTNQQGEHFIRHGAKSCSVTVWLDGGAEIEWVKVRGQSGRYFVSNDAGRVTYEKTNGEVPPDVAALLRVSVSVAGEAFLPGIQRQHDPPFLFADSARHRAQVLGEFDGSNLLLMADGEVRRVQRAAQAEATGIVAALEAHTRTVEAHEWVADAQVHLAVAADQFEGRRQVAERAMAVRSLASSLESLRTTRDDRARVIAASDVSAVGPLVARALDLSERAEGARRLVADLAYARQRRGVHEAALGVALPSLEALEAAQERAEASRTMLAVLGGARQAAGAAGVAFSAAMVERAAALEALGDVLGEACPACGQPLTAAGLGLAE